MLERRPAASSPNAGGSEVVGSEELGRTSVSMCLQRARLHPSSCEVQYGDVMKNVKTRHVQVPVAAGCGGLHHTHPELLLPHQLRHRNL